jgi:hypothetical protein
VTPNTSSHDADHHSGGGDLARPEAARQDHRGHRLHRLDRQRQAIEKARGDEKGGKAKENSRRSQAGDGHCPDRVRDKGAEIAARAACFLED